MDVGEVDDAELKSVRCLLICSRPAFIDCYTLTYGTVFISGWF